MKSSSLLQVAPTNFPANLNEVTYYFLVRCCSAMRNLNEVMSRGVLRKKCSENMQQVYWRTPMPKSDSNTVAGTLLKSHFSVGVLL